MKGLEARMSAIQDELDATTLRIEDLRTRQDELSLRRGITDLEINRIERKQEALAARVEVVARDLYMGGDDATLEVLLSSNDLGELASRLEYMTAVDENNDRLFLEQERTGEELVDKRDELEAQVSELSKVEGSLTSESNRLQEQFVEARDEYEALERKLAAQARERAAAQEQAGTDGVRALPKPGAGGLVCPIDGPNSFIDSWGFPRSGGRTHEGTDMMAAFGTPVVAIADGNITYVGVGESAGNWLILSADNGDAYWYMHNKENLTSGGPVKAGELIATVGDTGNAIGGPPHVHFEYHPGGGGPVNPYALLAGIC
ncbi:MAG: peptidoglycan DD-metalloendopeptidase family protein [Actinomycetota bacterium]|nr:peptidoglycan DD-metalloendopeptidase family protein [Actinomycetota bacterium]